MSREELGGWKVDGSGSSNAQYVGCCSCSILCDLQCVVLEVLLSFEDNMFGHAAKIVMRARFWRGMDFNA